MKQILAMILAVTLVFGCVPVPAFAEETTETTAAAETTAATTAPTEETVTEPTPVTVTGISVAAYPAKTVYQTGETLDLTGGSVSVSYSDGTSQTVAMTVEMVSGFNNTAAFTQTLTVAYEGFEAYFDVSVTAPISSNETEVKENTEETNVTEPSASSYAVTASEKEVSWIDVTPPTKRQYVVNQDELDVSGGLIRIVYTDGTEEMIPMTIDMVSGFENTSVGTLWLSFYYNDYHPGGYWVAIVESEDQPLVIETEVDMGNSKTVYYQYESLQLDGANLVLLYSDGTKVNITITAEMIPSFNTDDTGWYGVPIQYEGDISGYYSYEVITTDMLSGSCGDNAYWEIFSDGILSITGSGEVASTPWRSYEELINSIEVNSGITKLCSWAFSSCENVYEVSLPSTLEVIEYGAFAGCHKLTAINIPQKVTAIESSTFSECVSLSNISLPKNITEIGYEAFYGCTALTEITIPEKLDFLGSQAFANCTNLQKITFAGKESPSGRGSNIFENVTATGYYPGTSYWRDSFFEGCGGNIEWIAVGEVADSIKFDRDSYECILGSDGTSLNIVSTPGYVAVDCEFAVDNDAVNVEKTQYGYYLAVPQKAGTATITATDKRSGCTATATIKVVSPQEITCPYEETIQSDTHYVPRQYTFTPVETGKYILTGKSNDPNNRCTFYVDVSYFQDGDWHWEESAIMDAGDHYRFGYSLEAGKTYQISMTCYDQLPDDASNVNAVFSLDKSAEVTGIEIIGENREVYGAVGETFHHYRSIAARLLPENTAGDIIWESSNPELISVYQDGYDYGLKVQGEGSAVLTAKHGDFSDSITVTTKKPQNIYLNTPVVQTLKPYESYYYAFTPEETGRYAFEANVNMSYGECWFAGKYQPEDTEHSQSGSTNLTYGTFTAGVTYYYFVSSYDAGEEGCTSIITVKKEEAKPVAMEVVNRYGGETSMNFGVEFIPSNSYDKIISWETSNSDILGDSRYGWSGSDTSHNFNIYGSGEVTITAISESGLRASCTVTVGQCYNGHTYGPWKQTKAKTCTIDGQETAICVCGLRKYQPIPATGHSYDHNCDTECNECGATRTATHDFGEIWLYSETVHWHVCVNCGERSQIQNHIPGAAATQDAPQTCTECGYVIKGALGHSHSYGTELTVDEAGHWYACSGCNARKNYNAHSYTNVCDADCNDCGYTRKNVHVSGGTWVSDKAGHWQSCTKCNTKLDYAAHVPGAAATAQTPQICSICRYEIQKATGSTTTNTVTNTIYQTVTKPSTSNHTHKYSDMLTLDEVGHWYACSGCTSKKEYAKHTFMNDCDADCDTCGYTRAVSHATEANWSADGTGHWYSCKDCGEKVGFTSHQAENGICMICKHTTTASQVPTATMPDEGAATVHVIEQGNVATNETDTYTAPAQDESVGMPWWMMIVAGVVSSAATLGIVAIVIWVNRKKIVAMFMGK